MLQRCAPVCEPKVMLFTTTKLVSELAKVMQSIKLYLTVLESE